MKYFFHPFLSFPIRRKTCLFSWKLWIFLGTCSVDLVVSLQALYNAIFVIYKYRSVEKTQLSGLFSLLKLKWLLSFFFFWSKRCIKRAAQGTVSCAVLLPCIVSNTSRPATHIQIFYPQNLAKYRFSSLKFGKIQIFFLEIWQNTDFFRNEKGFF